MSTDLFQALTLGLLVIVILALLVVVSMLGKVRAALETRLVRAEPEPERSDSSTGEEPATVDAAVAEVAGTDAGPSTEEAQPMDSQASGAEARPLSDDGETEPEITTSAGASLGGDDHDSERPFERGGRWYFRRAGELLVYEEGTGEWVPAPEEAATPRPAIRRQVAAVEASNEPPVAGASEERPEDGSTTGPSTSFAGQPLSAAEEQVESLGEVGPVEEGAVATSFEEPGGGTVDLDEAATVAEDPAGRAGETFWKCASCGAINGSTATSCRMCFAARP